MDVNGQSTTGIVPRDVALAMTGIEFLNALRTGTLIAPPFSETTGIKPVEIEPGRLVFDGVPSERFYNPMGTVHGGWVATLLDSAMACAIQSMLPAGQTYTTLELKTNFVRPVFECTGTLRCEGTLLSIGGRIASAEGKVYDQQRNLIAHGSETCLIIKGRSSAEPSTKDRGD